MKLLLPLFLFGCISPQYICQADWQIAGEKDGANGIDKFGSYLQSCVSYGFNLEQQTIYKNSFKNSFVNNYCSFEKGKEIGKVNGVLSTLCTTDYYKQGYQEGLIQWRQENCSYEKGYSRGLENLELVTNHCSNTMYREFLNGYNNGKKEWVNINCTYEAGYRFGLMADTLQRDQLRKKCPDVYKRNLENGYRNGYMEYSSYPQSKKNEIEKMRLDLALAREKQLELEMGPNILKCTFNSECGEGFVTCSNGVCVDQDPKIPARCTVSKDCPFNFSCFQEECVKSCSSKIDCPMFYECKNGICSK